ncbi:permease-like cell division protein FtsX [Streptococcus suis]|uniref:permease-like cell division protein FtsX n=1 Tax=Streptococcus suis TaxID=1307 RepID=UPI00137A3135|nr:permease-like cell division protein FtsX [Streptococcus suis]MBY5014273.1 permease-like cell division protein FtsX [Streptococcus suis]MBY5025239.1 permease-like cell division protein FtsX [Streptococcus suis]MBY5029565.1 permease-like cell division protein FtsX [Streptococcus suis]MCL4935596.1 permease-like cell division protein FtsX [Streptococcus suis]QTA56332.1 ABC transporter permease [Streptococcus suis]
MSNRFFRHFIESLKSLKRNGWMTIAAISSVAITLTLVGLFASVILNTAKLASDLEQNVRINVYLRANSTDQVETIVNEGGETVANPDYQKVYNQITALENVQSVTYSSKDEQLQKLTATLGDTWNLFQGDANPLYDAYIIDTTEPQYVKTVAAEIAKIDGVTEVRDGEVETERIFKLANLVRTWGLAATGLLLFTAVFLISNTIRITIISRSREIQIMRLVGAKNSYIRGPFLWEGAWVGLLGAILPSVLVYSLYKMIYTSVNASLASQDLSLISMNVFVPGMIGALFVIGIIIGSLGSVISMNRYLKI